MFQVYMQNLPNVTFKKVNTGVFVGPKIRKLMNDEDFIGSMNPREAPAWKPFVGVVRNFLGNNRSENYVKIVKKKCTC